MKPNMLYIHIKYNLGWGQEWGWGDVIGFHFVPMYINVTSLHVDRSQSWLLRK